MPLFERTEIAVPDRSSPSTGPLRERLAWDSARGRIADGPRRYLMMRPDVLMGALRGLAAPVRATALDAFARSVAEHGADSIRAYSREVGADPAALLAATVSAAADLGWGAWTFEPGRGRLGLVVAGSPFAEGWGAADAPVCAPVRGMLQAVSSVAVGLDADAHELECAACGAPACRFEARWAAC
jgi:predicted hydrocarbon binding protein